MLRPLRVLLCWTLALRAFGPSPTRGDEPSPRPRDRDEPPVYVLMDDGDDLDDLRKKLARPDFVILKGTLYDALKGAARPIDAPRRGLVESVAVSGEVLEDLAHLTVEFGVALTGADPAWVPIRLDGQIVASAREGDRDLPIRAAEGGWQVQVKGDGLHRVQVTLSSPVLAARSGAEGRRLEWAIPEAASTRVQIALPANATDVVANGASGAREPLAVEPIEGAQRSRASAYLTPRANLEIAWKIATEPSSNGPPLVTAQGEIALDVERGSVRARSSWEIHSERGSLKRLDLRIDPADELVGLELDNKPVSGEEPRDPSSGAIAVPLVETVPPGGSCRLTVTTRRPISPETATRTTYRGVTIRNVASQEGVIAIRQGGPDPWVTASPGRGLRAIDPRTDLPAGLRSRPSIVLAYGFVEQPFDLGLQIDPSPPTVAVESRTTVSVASNRARVDSWLDFSVTRGRIFEVRLALPKELTIDAVGPETVVAAYETQPGGSGRRDALVVRLAPRAGEDGKFSVHLAGRQALSAKAPASIGLPQPIDAKARGGLLAVTSERNVLVEPASGSPSDFAPATGDPPASWPWPTSLQGAVSTPSLWLRHEDAPAALPLAISIREREVRDETTLEARVERRRLDVRQESAVRVRFGTLSRIDIEVPREVEGRWEPDSLEIARREPLGPGPNGVVRHRLTLAREVTDLARLRFRIRQPLDPPLEADRPAKLRIPRITIAGAEGAPPRVRVGAEEGIDLEGDGIGWSTPEGEEDRASGAVLLEHAGAGPAAIVATAHARASLPPVVASRLSLRTSQQPDGGLRTTAAYRLERHEGSVVVALPGGAEWVRARVGEEAASEVDRASTAPGVYRLRLPPTPGPLSVVLEYAQPAASASGAWRPPLLREGGVVQETTWEVRLPSQLALAGVPRGWSDENRWAWKTYVFMREPIATGEDSPKDGAHAYAFGRIGEPSELEPWIVSRAGLVGVCSGVVLALGLALMTARPSLRRLWPAPSLLALAALALVPPSLIPLALQSSIAGFVLLAIASATQSLVDRRRPVNLTGGSLSSRSSLAATPEIGSEESTVIRRHGTTADHPAAPASAPEPAPAGTPS